MTTQSIEITTPDGTMPAVLARPEGAGPHPAVVVIMEAFGLVPHIQAVAERLAAAGYVAIAPDVYYRQLPDNKVSYDQLPRAIELMQTVDDAKFIEDLRATLSFLRGRPEVSDKIGITGFCMGGRLSFLVACALPGEISACASFYGGGIVSQLSQADAIACPVYLFFGDKDAFIPLEQVREIDAKLAELGTDYKLKTYEGAEHGFFCDERESYQDAAASDAWKELTGFLDSSLR